MDGGQLEIVNVNANLYSFVPYLASATGIEMAKLASQPAVVLPGLMRGNG